jgi:hypothetical protein
MRRDSRRVSVLLAASSDDAIKDLEAHEVGPHWPANLALFQ